MERRVIMRVTKQSGAGNTIAVFGISYRKLATMFLAYGTGILLYITPLFSNNWIALAGYFVLASILVGETPTKRSMFNNIYGVVFKKPIKMVVSKLATINTFGHGVREVELVKDIDVPAIKLNTGLYALVYVVTSGINQWSTSDDYLQQATMLKQLFNVMEATEGIDIVTKEDSDTGMLSLKEMLDEREHFEGDDFKALSDKRKHLLYMAATSDIGRSVQQYIILKVKPRNVKRTINALKKAVRIMRPATYPMDVLMSAMGLEGGTMLTPEDYKGESDTKERPKRRKYPERKVKGGKGRGKEKGKAKRR